MSDPGPLHAVLTMLAGVATGVLSAAMGVGGAIVSTPAIRALGVSAALAVGTTLPSILPSAVSGTVRYAREGLIRWDVVAWTAPPGVIAAVAGSALSARVPGDGHLLMVVTAVLLGLTAWRMARGTDADPAAEAEPATGTSRRHGRAILLAVGAAAGLLAGLLGVGGGLIVVPGLSELAGLPLKKAIATSLACVGILAVPATLAHWFLGDIDWAVAGWLSLGVVPGARLGAAAAIKLSTQRLRLAVAGFLGVVALVHGVSEAVALVRT